MTDTAPLERWLDEFPGIETYGGLEFEGWKGGWAVTLEFTDDRAGSHAREYLGFYTMKSDTLDLKLYSAMPVPERPGEQSYWTLEGDAYLSPQEATEGLHHFYEGLYNAPPTVVCEAADEWCAQAVE